MDRDAKRKAIKEVKTLLTAGSHDLAWARLAAVSDPDDDLALQSQYAKLAGTVPAATLGGQPIKIALLGSSTLDHFGQILQYWLTREGFAAEIHVAEFNTIRQTALDSGSSLYAFKPDIVWIFTGHRDVLMPVEPGSAAAVVTEAVHRAVSDLQALWDAIRQRTPAFIVQNNADLPPERTFGNFEGSVGWSRSNLLRRFNLALADALPGGVTLFDLDAVSSLYGKGRWADARYWHHSKHAFALDAIGPVAFRAARLVASLRGRAKKCLVLDLDNTLWGGVIGDDGLEGIRLGNGAEGEAFVAFQDYLLGLKRRGVLLAVSSKNEETNALEPFAKHPDMRIKRDDITVFRANWNNKADNIRDIATVLNIGLDALVFVDDNPAERDLVRQLLPMVAVPEMPPDPSDYVHALDRHHFFETTSFSDEDRERGRLYQENAAREEARGQFTDISGYLVGLEMVAKVGICDRFHVSRMAQLVNKSNQFHLTGTRYTESDLQAFAADPNKAVRFFKLSDKFGDNGLISVVVLAERDDGMFIDTWVMSCRVLSRGMEEFICAELVDVARDRGRRRLIARYVPSKKNQLVAGLYERLGFTKSGENTDASTDWELALGPTPPKYDVHIRRDTEPEGKRE